MLFKQNIFLLSLFLLATSCGHSHGDGREKVLDGFADAYFNYDFQTAAKFCSPESSKWLRYEASQMTQADVDRLASKGFGAAHSIVDVENLSDSLAQYTLDVNDYYATAALDSVGRVVDHMLFKVSLRRRNNNWEVVLDSPLRPYKPCPNK